MGQGYAEVLAIGHLTQNHHELSQPLLSIVLFQGLIQVEFRGKKALGVEATSHLLRGEKWIRISPCL